MYDIVTHIMFISVGGGLVDTFCPVTISVQMLEDDVFNLSLWPEFRSKGHLDLFSKRTSVSPLIMMMEMSSRT